MASTSSYSEWYLYGCGTEDADADGIPDAIDPYPNDPWNNTQYYWAGGDWLINGIPTNFDAVYHSGLISPDSDGDGIPDDLDPYPTDSANNTWWWSGGTFLMNGTWQSFGGCYHAMNAGDADGDGIPDDLDPFPNDATNNSAVWWGGSYMVDGASVWLPDQWHPANEPDSDGDGIPDSLDPYPNDSSNHSFWWAGGSFTAANGSLWFAATWYAGTWNDSDGDGIPDSLDPYVNDALNGIYFYWQGGTFPIGGTMQTWAAGNYPGSWSDSDYDGIPDSLDPYPGDANNANPPMFWWEGGTFMVNSQWQVFPGQICFGQRDPYGYLPDADRDGIPDTVDPFPSDRFNNTPGFVWPPLDYSGGATSWTINVDNVPVTFTSALYYTQWQDSDGDGIPDVADPHQADYYNGNDSDGDGIRDSVELAYGLNPYDPSDAAAIRYVYIPQRQQYETDGLTWKQAYDRGWLDWLQDSTTDTDGDGMSDLYETVNGLDPHNPADAVDAPIAHLPPGATATMNDFILNIEKARASVPLSHVVADSNEFNDITNHGSGEIVSHDFTKSVAENDWDGDGVSNWDEVLVFHTDPRDPTSRPADADLLTAYLDTLTSLSTNLYCVTHFATTDTDGDGIPDVVEHQYGLDPNDASDASQIRYIDGETDGLTRLEAYQQGRISALKPGATDAVGVALASSVAEDGYWYGGGGTGTYTTSDTPFSRTGSYGFVLFDPETGDEILRYGDVLTETDVEEYERMKALASTSPGQFDGAEWKTGWETSVTEALDAEGEPILDENETPILRGAWSGTHHKTTEIVEPAAYVKTGATVSNDRIVSPPPPAPESMTEYAGAWKGGGDYRFTDIPRGGEGDGVAITSAAFDGMRDAWLAIDQPDPATRLLYEPNGTPLSASTSADDGKTFSSRLAFWLKTDNGERAAHDITRRYIKVTTDEASGNGDASPFFELVQLTIQKGQKTSEIIFLQPSPGQTQSLETVEFEAADRENLDKGFDPPMLDDVHKVRTAIWTERYPDRDQWEWWTSLGKGADFNVNNKVAVRFQSVGLAKACEIAVVEGSDIVSVYPTRPTQASEPLTIWCNTANGGQIQEATIEVRARIGGVKLARLKVMVMPVPTQPIPVKLYKIRDSIDPPQTDVGAIPKAADVQKELNARFHQACLRFEVQIVAEPTELPWDKDGDNKLRDPDLEKNTPALQEFNVFRTNPTFNGHVPVIFVGRLDSFESQGYALDGRILMHNLNFTPGDLEDFEEEPDGSLESRERVVAHEVGHLFGIAIRGQPYEVLGTTLQTINPGGHDDGPFPTRTTGLMRAGSEPGKWLRHEDWKAAWENARVEFRQYFPN